MNIQDIKNIQSLILDTLNVFTLLGTINIDSERIKDLYKRLDNIDYSVFSKIIEEPLLSILHDYNKAYFYLKPYLVDDLTELLPPDYDFRSRIERMGLNKTAINDIIELWKLFEGVILSIGACLNEVREFIEETGLNQYEQLHLHELTEQLITVSATQAKNIDSIIERMDKSNQMCSNSKETSQSQEYEESGDCLREVRRDTESVGLAANCINNTDDGQCGKDDEEGDLTADDILLRTIFGKHLPNFLKEAKLAKTGTGVARIVNNYVREYDLKKNLAKTGDLNKPLWQALSSKGIIKIKNSAWNSAIK